MKTTIIAIFYLIANSGFSQDIPKSMPPQWIKTYYPDSSGFSAEWYQDTLWQYDRTHTSVVIRYTPLRDSLKSIKNRYVENSGEIYEYYAYSVDWIDFDCRAERYRIMYRGDYNDDHSLIRDALPTELPKWQFVTIGGILDTILVKTCKY